MSEACVFFMSEIVFVYVRMFIKNREKSNGYLFDSRRPGKLTSHHY